MMVYGNPLRSNLVALVVPSESKLRSSLDESHSFRSEIPLDQLCASDQVRLLLLGKLKDHSAKHYLNAYEEVANILLVPALDPEFFTTVGKLKRAKVLETYGEQLEALYRK